MRVIIAGTRTITDYDIVKQAIIESGFTITEIVCGLAKGPDILGEQYSKENNIPVTYFPADWKGFGKAAGHIRNEQMGDYTIGGGLIAIWDGQSRGTRHMIDYARRKGLLVYIKNVNDTTENFEDLYG